MTFALQTGFRFPLRKGDSGFGEAGSAASYFP
jgi:hypothetical protein